MKMKQQGSKVFVQESAIVFSRFFTTFDFENILAKKKSYWSLCYLCCAYVWTSFCYSFQTLSKPNKFRSFGYAKTIISYHQLSHPGQHNPSTSLKSKHWSWTFSGGSPSDRTACPINLNNGQVGFLPVNFTENLRPSGIAETLISHH